ncbi:hypothetical protein GCM10022245_53020 [Streptomyces mayteni]
MPPAGGGAAGAPGAPPLYVALVGTLFAAVGSFLAFSTFDAGGGQESSIGLRGDGVYTLTAGLKASGLLVAGLIARKARFQLTLWAALPTLAVLFFALLNLANPERAVTSELQKKAGLSGAEADRAVALLDVSAGVGVWLVLIGGLVCLGSIALVAARSRRR